MDYYYYYFFWSMLVINYKGINEIDQVTMYISLLVE